MVLLFLFMDMLSIFTIEAYSLIIFLISGYSILISGIMPNKNRESINLQDLIIVACLGIVPAIIITQYSPYPFIVSSDIFNHLHYSLRLLENNEVVYMQPYLPTFHVLMSSALYISNAYEEPLAILWALRFFSYPLYSIGLYIFTYNILRKRVVSFFSAIIGAWILILIGGDSGLYNFTPRMALYILLPYILYAINKLFNDNANWRYKNLGLKELSLFLLPIIIFSYMLFFSIWYNQDIYPNMSIVMSSIILSFFLVVIMYREKEYVKYMTYLFLIFLSILIIHNAMGIVLINLIILYLLVVWLIHKKPMSRIFLLLFPLVTFSMIILQKNELLTIQNMDIFNTWMPQSFSYKYSGILKSFPEVILTFTIFGTIISVENKKIAPSMCILCIIIILYFLPISDITRVLLFATPFISLFSAYAMYKIIKISIQQAKCKYILTTSIYMILIPLIILSLFSPYLTAIQFFVNFNGTEGHYSHFTQYEYDAGQWIKQNTAKDSLILSDRNTEFIIGGLANRDIVIGRGKDRMFEEVEIVADIMLNNDSNTTYEKIKAISNDESLTMYNYGYSKNHIKHNITLVVINGRTVSYLKAYSKTDRMSVKLITGMPSDFERFEGFEKFFDEKYFKLVYHIPDKIYVFEVKVV